MLHWEGMLRALEVVSAEGIESALKRKFNNIQAHGWHKKHCKDVVIRLTDREVIAKLLKITCPQRGICSVVLIPLASVAYLSVRESKGVGFWVIVETKRDMKINVQTGPSETFTASVFRLLLVYLAVP